MMAHDQLATFVAAMARRPGRWGRDDCLMVLADWVRERTGIDPAAAWRGTYRTRREAKAILDRAGGVVAHVESCILTLGWSRDPLPERGDIGIVRVPALDEHDVFVESEVGAICLEPGLWAVKTMIGGGMAAGDFPVVCSWSHHG